MKNTKTMLLLLVGGTVTFALGLVAYSMMESLGTFEYVMAGAVLVIVLFSIILGMKRLKDEKKLQHHGSCLSFVGGH